MILTIDVGIKNLAICILNAPCQKDIKSYEIKLWKVLNTIDKTPVCNSCDNTCSYSSGKDFLCKKHYLSCENKKDYKCHKVKTRKISSLLLQDIVECVIKALDNIVNDNTELFLEIDKLLIELQPKVNNKMKLISHTIYTYFAYHFLKNERKCIIRFITAKNKLKYAPKIECHLKSPYARRKYISVKFVELILREYFSEEQRSLWLESFLDSKKKDDLSDTLLYAINNSGYLFCM